MKKICKFVIICIMLCCFLGSCLTLGNSFPSNPRKSWTINNFANAPDVYYLLDTSSGTIISKSEYSTPPYIRDYSEITNFMFSENGLSFITSNIPQLLRNNTLNVTIEYHRSSSSIPLIKMDLIGNVRNANNGKWRIIIDYSDELKDFLLNMPENFLRGCFIKVIGYNGNFYFDFPNRATEFKEAWEELKQMKIQNN